MSDVEKAERKKTCEHWHQLKNGKIHPCDFANAVYSLGVADYVTDYVDLTEEIDSQEMKEKIYHYVNRPFYETCGHHAKNNDMTAMAAEQGYFDFRTQIK